MLGVIDISAETSLYSFQIGAVTSTEETETLVRQEAGVIQPVEVRPR